MSEQKDVRKGEVSERGVSEDVSEYWSVSEGVS